MHRDFHKITLDSSKPVVIDWVKTRQSCRIKCIRSARIILGIRPNSFYQVTVNHLTTSEIAFDRLRCSLLPVSRDRKRIIC